MHRAIQAGVPYILLVALLLGGCGEEPKAVRQDGHTLSQAKQLVRQGKLKEALAAYELLVREQRTLAVAWADKAYIHCRLGNFAPAIADARRALEYEPNLAAAHATLGLAYYRAGRESDAVAALEHALRLEKGLAEALSTLGAIYYKRRELELARRTLEAAVQANGKLPEANFNLALALDGRAQRKTASGTGDPTLDRKEALKYFRRFLDLGDGGPEQKRHARERMEAIRTEMQADGELGEAGGG